MADIVPIGHARARGRQRLADDLAARIEAVRIEAESAGFSQLSYFLDIAVTEALVQARRAEEARAERHCRGD